MEPILEHRGTLTLSLKGEYFDQIAAGTKPFEYRVVKEYWRKRLEGCTYDEIILTKGYPKADDVSRRMRRRWNGFHVETIIHPHFGPDPVEVFAIDVSVPFSV